MVAFDLNQELHNTLIHSRRTDVDVVEQYRDLRNMAELLADQHPNGSDAYFCLHSALELTKLWDETTADPMRVRESMCVLRIAIAAHQRGHQMFVGA